MIRAALILACGAALLGGCEREEPCRPARVTARAEWLRYRVAVRAQLERSIAALERKLRQAKARQARRDALQACLARAAARPSGPPPPCLQQAGLTRAPTREELLAEQRALAGLHKTQARLTRETGRIDRIDATIKRLDCPADAVRRASRGVPADPGPRARLLRAATVATERLCACAEGHKVADDPHCR